MPGDAQTDIEALSKLFANSQKTNQYNHQRNFLKMAICTFPNLALRRYLGK